MVYSWTACYETVKCEESKQKEQLNKYKAPCTNGGTGLGENWLLGGWGKGNSDFWELQVKVIKARNLEKMSMALNF